MQRNNCILQCQHVVALFNRLQHVWYMAHIQLGNFADINIPVAPASARTPDGNG